MSEGISLYRGKRTFLGEWVYGYIYRNSERMNPFIMQKNRNAESYEVDPDTVGEFTGVFDNDLSCIYTGDIVSFCGYIGVVVFEEGSFGIAIDRSIDWGRIEEEMRSYGIGNSDYFCFNDNFISFYEILWNFCCEEEECTPVKVIGNKWDNPELLKGENRK